jgi:Uma2 family endonuclease
MLLNGPDQTRVIPFPVRRRPVATEISRAHLRVRYYQAAQEYLRSLPLEHFMEATPHATQREITLESLDLVAARRSDFHLFNELLVQYPVKGQKKPGQVVPDNMVVLYDGELKPEGSYDVPLEPAAPFWVLEYVSKSSQRKDYDDSREHYEKRLKVPYYLLFYPEAQELSLFRHNGRRFVSVKPNEHGRLAIPKLELEVALQHEWVRFWYRGELLPLPADLLRERDESRRQLDEANRRVGEVERRAEQEQQACRAAEAEIARLRAELDQLRRRPKHHK